ncbi:MAG: hypothetical protein ABIH00_10100 [Armatimonadota bacterium]
MSIKILRRILIAVVFIVLLLNAYFYWAAEKEITKRELFQQKRWTLALMFDSGQEADAVKSLLDKSGINSSYKHPYKDYKKKLTGYVVAQDFPKNDAFESIKVLLKQKGYSVKEEDIPKLNKFKIYVGSVYTDKSKAIALAAEVYKKTSVRFEAEKYYKSIPSDYHALIITDLEKSEAKDILSKLENEYGKKINSRLTEKPAI